MVYRYNYPCKIKDITSNYFAKLNVAIDFKEIKIFIYWHEIVNNEYGKASTPQKIIANGKKKKLIIEIYDPKLIVQFDYNKQTIIDKINLYLGTDYINDIKIIQNFLVTNLESPKTENSIKEKLTDQTIEEINDHSIRKILYAIKHQID